MRSLPKISAEPTITIGLCPENEGRIIQTPDGLKLEGFKIGRGFHWTQKRTITLEGNLFSKNGILLLELPLERYITSVISSEMNPQACREFLKAHAIISRGWALGKVMHLHHAGGGQTKTDEQITTWTDTDAHHGFDVCPDDHCQRFQGFDITNEKTHEAVAATRGIVLTNHDGELTDARFSKCCGGRTEVFSTCWQDIYYPEMTSVADPYCDLSNLTKEERHKLLQNIMKDYDAATTDFFRWERIVSPNLINNRLIEIFNRDLGDIKEMSAVERGPSGRIKHLLITGTKGRLLLGKELAIRQALSSDCLYSSAFEIIRDNEAFILRGRGWGHGVGLCQIGAARMAHEGATYKEILNHYYPGAILTKFYE